MGDMADYDMYENINNVGRAEVVGFKCGYCGKSYGKDKAACQRHVNNCSKEQS
jgi:hypothetical protein